jgi:hypothetical protein
VLQDLDTTPGAPDTIRSVERALVILALLVVQQALAGCGHPNPGPDEDLGRRQPEGPCSDLGKTIYRWQGREELCAPAADQRRELMAVEDGLVLEWVPTTGRNRLWRVADGDLPLGAAPLRDGVFNVVARSHLLYPLGGLRVLDVQTVKVPWSIWSVEPNTLRPSTTAIGLRVNEGTFSAAFWGQELLALDGDHLLKWWPGTGEYVVLRFDRPNERRPDPSPLEPTPFHGKRDLLLRGARLVNLGGGSHRLLEWVPHTGQRRIWSYSFAAGAATPDIFGAEPVTPAAVWTDVGREHEIVVTGADRILLWDRRDGRVTLRAFDPLAVDPLAGPVVGEHVYPELRSPDRAPPRRSAIENLVLVLQDGRSFDSYFGQYCLAPANSSPLCDEGPTCCEAMPAEQVSACTHIDGATAEQRAPNATAECLAAKINGGTMDGFASAPGCGDPRDVACAGSGAEAGAIGAYHALVDGGGALADRFFQSTLDGSDANIVYLSKAAWGGDLASEAGLRQLTHLTAEAGVRWALYLDDPRDPVQVGFQAPPLFEDPHWTHYRWRSELARDIALEQLGEISLVVQRRTLSERAGAGPAAEGIAFVTGTAAELGRSPRYGRTALTLVTYLTSGGFYDHVPPPEPPSPAIDNRRDQPVAYGPRVPLLALGPFVRPRRVSHVPMELSSLVTFMEWNWLGGTGQLARRDTIACNIGSLLDPERTGAAVPECR